MSDRLTIPAAVVRYLRRGLIGELDAATEQLRFQLERDPIEAKAYREAFASITATGMLLDVIGVADDRLQRDVELDVSDSPDLVLRALQLQYDLEVARLQDAEASGVALPRRDVPALGDCVAAVRKAIDQIAHSTGADARGR